LLEGFHNLRNHRLGRYAFFFLAGNKRRTHFSPGSDKDPGFSLPSTLTAVFLFPHCLQFLFAPFGTQPPDHGIFFFSAKRAMFFNARSRSERRSSFWRRFSVWVFVSFFHFRLGSFGDMAGLVEDALRKMLFLSPLPLSSLFFPVDPSEEAVCFHCVSPRCVFPLVPRVFSAGFASLFQSSFDRR